LPSISGIRLLALNIIGEYLARAKYRTMNRPVPGVRERTGNTKSMRKTQPIPNLDGMPIVETPADPIDCFYRSGIEALIMNRYLLEK
jgi:hypothetical protein